MPQVTEHTKQFYSSRPLVPDPKKAGLNSDQLRKLYFSTTTQSVFVKKEVPMADSSFSDVHKASQKVGCSNANKAPFWSRDMTRYQQTFIHLPMDGANINRELASTFNPDDQSSSVSRKWSVPIKGQSRYNEDYAHNVRAGVDYRLPNCKPKIQKHVNEKNHLLFTDSVTHEVFHTLPAMRPRDAFRPAEDKPTNSSAGFRFNGSTRYSEEFTDLSTEGYRVELVKGRDDSNRVKGNSIPNRVKEYLFEAGNVSPLSLEVPIEDIVRGKAAPPPEPLETVSNPYLQDYLAR